MFPSASPRGTLRVSGKQNSLFPLGPVIKCLLSIHEAQRDHILTTVMTDIVVDKSKADLQQMFCRLDQTQVSAHSRVRLS